ncbi:MAG TPA: MtrB/PioB family outer membrane beta-barrel protein, partial [Vicinamibacteria bacterium]|nr:MtrB/PioB family outer membrane beta-barrel protein [Vicinamibacteria bacterium]
DVQYEGSWGVVRGGVHYNWFGEKLRTFAFDNPFRATDATDASAYLGPGSSSIAGPRYGLMSLPPDNSAFTGTVGTTLRLPSRTRVSADVSIGSRRQNETPFIPYTTNTAIRIPGSTLLPTDVASLPARQLDGKADVTSLSAMVSSRPAGRLSVTARYRRYDFDNQTGRIAFPGYVRFDGVWEDIPRISVPYGYTNNRFDATLGYGFGPLNLEGGFRHTSFARTFRETEDTRENGFVFNADFRTAGWVLVRGLYELGRRDFDGLEIELSEDASFQNPGAPANLFAVEPTTRQVSGAPLCPPGTVCNLRFDQSKRDFDRFGGQVQLSPGGDTTIAFAYSNTMYDYTESRFGLTESKYETFSADVDYAPNARWSVYAYYNREAIRDVQRGRQSAGTVSSNPADDWTSEVDDRVNSVGGGARFTLVPDKWTLDVSGQYQKVDGNNDIEAFPGGLPFNARAALGGVQDLGLYDDTRITTFSATLRYRFSRDWETGVAGWFEDYTINDSNTAGVLNYVPGSFFLVPNDGDYQAKWGYLFLTYRF